MMVAEAIKLKLGRGLAPSYLEVIDQSHIHAGHAGARSQGESHFAVNVVSAAFIGKSRIERQRMVYDLLAEEIADGLHALSLRTLTPEESAGDSSS